MVMSENFKLFSHNGFETSIRDINSSGERFVRLGDYDSLLKQIEEHQNFNSDDESFQKN